LTVGIAVGDYFAGETYLVSLLYFVPLVVVTWYAGRLVALPLAVAAAVASSVARAEALGWGWTDAAAYVNGARQLIAYVIVIFVLAALRDALRRARDLALIDPLTGLANRRAFLERATQQLPASRRSDDPLAVAYLDLDDFKAVNDTLGHEAGDRLLADVARALREHVRASDVVARFGGDEFCVLLPGADLAAARHVAEKLVAAVTPLCRDAIPDGGVSAGVAVFADAPAQVGALLVAADRAMYGMKRAGRGGLVVEKVDAEGHVVETVTEPGHDGGPRPARTPVPDA
jgi:diguanylate cyclase (GGDEF)-like protein